MEIKFIGTGSGRASLVRHHTSILLRTQNHSVLIDSGDGTAEALQKQNISPDEISTIIITHHHADHFAGIASLITQQKLNNRTKDLAIYTHDKLVKSLISFLNTCYLFQETLGFSLQIKGYATKQEVFINTDLKFIAEQNSHITNKHNLTGYPEISFISCSLLIVSENKTIVYTSDIGSANDLYLFKDREMDFYICETTHVSLEEILLMLSKSNIKKLLLTHIDDEFAETIKSKVRESKESEKIIITEDGLTIKL